MRLTAETRERVVAWQRQSKSKRALHASLTLLQVALWAAALWTWHRGWIWATVLVWGGAVVVAHNKLLAFHEAAHGTLYPDRRLNEFIGEMIGCVAIVPLTAFRIVHSQHHAYVGTERDLEFWPFVDPAVPRWQRVLAVTGELLCGYLYDPLITLRGVCVARSVPVGQRRKAFVEYAFVAVIWLSLAAVLTWRGWWLEFCIAFFIPAYLAACVNATRRMIEHLGMLGDTVESKTRTVIPAGVATEAMSAVALRTNYHAAHHRFGRIPYYHLPEATESIYADELEQMAVYPSYWRAFLDMLPHLLNPRIGGQWLKPANAHH